MIKLDVPYFKQDTKYSCGAATVQMLLSYFGIRESEEALIHELKANNAVGTRHRHLIDAVRRYNLYCYVNNDGTLDQIEDFLRRELPSIVSFIEPSANDGHYALAIGLSKDAIILNDPWHGAGFTMDRHQFEDRWYSLYDKTECWYLVASPKDFAIGKTYQPLA